MFEQLTGLLPRLVRKAEGRDAEPPVCVLDSETIKTSANVHLADQGTDAGRRIIGPKRHLGCDTLGLCWPCSSPPPASPTPQPA